MAFMSCTELGKHCDDISDALKLIGKWLTLVAKLNNQELQQRLLSKIFPFIINDTMTDSLEIPSKLAVEIAMRMKNIELNNLRKVSYNSSKGFNNEKKIRKRSFTFTL